jgi:hypothetical protein
MIINIIIHKLAQQAHQHKLAQQAHQPLQAHQTQQRSGHIWRTQRIKRNKYSNVNSKHCDIGIQRPASTKEEDPVAKTLWQQAKTQWQRHCGTKSKTQWQGTATTNPEPSGDSPVASNQIPSDKGTVASNQKVKIPNRESSSKEKTRKIADEKSRKDRKRKVKNSSTEPNVNAQAHVNAELPVWDKIWNLTRTRFQESQFRVKTAARGT